MPLNGFLYIDKPESVTSRSVVNEVSRRLRTRKTGAEGILDPFASGVLVLGLGYATRFFPFLAGRSKEYTADLQLGMTTDTLDPTGEVTTVEPVPQFTNDHVAEVLASFRGPGSQMPPLYSNKKIDGVRARVVAREGGEVTLRPQNIEIHELGLISVSRDIIRFRARVSSGTYIRSLGRDIAGRLGTVGYLKSLRRTAIGEICESECVVLNSHLSPWGCDHPFRDREILALNSALADDLAHGRDVQIARNNCSVRIYKKEKFIGLGFIAGGQVYVERLIPQWDIFGEG